MDLKVVENPPAGSAMTDEGPIMINSTGSQLFELQNHVNYEHNIPPTPLLNTRTSQYFDLLDLPAEFKAIIYEMVPVIGKIFFTPGSRGWHSSARFEETDLYHESAQLLRVRKSWHREWS